jgi:SAM-dependent methyltransferase
MPVLWAFEKIYSLKPKVHVDIGSSVDFVGLLSVITKVQFIDIRPLVVSNVPNIQSIEGNILEMPYENESLESVSCLHVAEHIGLGRYGDSLDPHGTRKAATELSRCLAKGGNLFFSLPVGIPRLCFNAHRIHSPEQILRYFDGLKLVEFSGTDDNKRFMRNIDLEITEKSKYACGMFWFTKE